MFFSEIDNAVLRTREEEGISSSKVGRRSTKKQREGISDRQLNGVHRFTREFDKALENCLNSYEEKILAIRYENSYLKSGNTSGERTEQKDKKAH